MPGQIEVSSQSSAQEILRKRATNLSFIAGGILFALIAVGLGLWFGYNAPVGGVVEKSVAVLPFETVNAGPDDGFVTIGVQDEIRNDLASVAVLKVISRNSVVQYKPGIKRDVHQIADALGVAHVVEGKVEREGDRVRIHAKLTNARTGKTIWQKSYDDKLDDVFAIQNKIAKAVTEHLGATFAATEKPTAQSTAYERYIRAGILLDGIALDARS